MLISILDNDLYKFSMQQAVMKLYPNLNVKYAFKNRSLQTHRFNQTAYDQLLKNIQELDNSKLSEEEFDWLKSNCPYFTSEYLNYLKSFQFDTKKHVQTIFNSEDGSLQIFIVGNWLDTILYEVPLMAIVSATFFQTVDKDWHREGQFERAYEKGKDLIKSGCCFSEFGSRRRRDFETQDTVIAALIQAKKDCEALNANGSLLGTSNVYFAKKYDIAPIGTVSHEWTMAVSALEKDIKHANKNALMKWNQAYPNNFLIALTDTYGTKAFFDDFDLNLANQYDGLRQDSGNPLVFLEEAIHHYKKLGIDPSTKTIVFSDSLNVEKCKKIHSNSLELEGPKSVFGIGTFFTNDYLKNSNSSTSEKEKSNAMNIVIKLVEVDGTPVVKLSDDPNKRQGQIEAEEEVLKIFGMK